MSKYCYTCRRYCVEPALFCIQCGGSFDLKYCSRLHANSISAVYCRLCGSSDLSVPHRRPKRGLAGTVILLVASMSVAGSALTLVLKPLMQDDGIAPSEIVGGTTLICLAVVLW